MLNIPGKHHILQLIILLLLQAFEMLDSQPGMVFQSAQPLEMEGVKVEVMCHPASKFHLSPVLIDQDGVEGEKVAEVYLGGPSHKLLVYSSILCKKRGHNCQGRQQRQLQKPSIWKKIYYVS